VQIRHRRGAPTRTPLISGLSEAAGEYSIRIVGPGVDGGRSGRNLRAGEGREGLQESERLDSTAHAARNGLELHRIGKLDLRHVQQGASVTLEGNKNHRRSCWLGGI
jgi:hypothetical protein